MRAVREFTEEFILLRGGKHENVFTVKRGSSGYCDTSNVSPLYMYAIYHIHTCSCIYTYTNVSKFYIRDHIMVTYKNNKYIFVQFKNCV